MSISPNETFPFDPDSNIHPGELVLTMLDGILKEPVQIPAEDEMQSCDLFDMAMETEETEDAVEYLLKSLNLDPTNVDAHLQLLELAFIDDEYQIPILEKLEAIARQKLGEDLLSNANGHFWGMIETRPYMRVLGSLASECHYQGFLDEAVAYWEQMLTLNKNDNQGVRYHLLLTYLALGKLKKADKIFNQYDEVALSCCFSWGNVLRHFLAHKKDLALEALKSARKQNKYMESFIKGTRKPPMELPDRYAPGSREEAICFVDYMITAWEPFPKAIKWLKLQKK